MNEDRKITPNYNNPQCNHEYNAGNKQYENSYGEPSYLPANYDYQAYTDSFYEDNKGSGAGSFLFGALVGGVIGAAAALFLAPKSGSEMREDLTAQAIQLKDKSIELSTVAKEKAVEFTSVAKVKTGELSKSIQEQSGQLVEKVKSMKPKNSVPMDDGTASSEGEEAMDFIESATLKIGDTLEKGTEMVTSTAEALKKAVVEQTEGTAKNSNKSQTTGNSSVSYDNSENIGKNKITNQNFVSKINDDKK
ncbi:YtxH domain-containing protein [Sporosarcina limicola]|uniref:Gas vesicle protein n=1 Tax=Sporosarcina limicola TaxID=34101 RepID=A0A927MID0_9BACL|nr:YtxH domain-containing protein [Sporosarcina limicola]MBE1554361.1 gas vesicle protein [Sporosarcina limicola]